MAQPQKRIQQPTVKFTERDGIITATIPLLTRDGRLVLVSGSASIEETAGEFGIEPDVSGLFGKIGKFFKKVTKNKAFKKAFKITKSILKSPITTAALGVVTGGAAIAPMAAINVAMNVADEAAKGSKKAKNLIKSATALTDKKGITKGGLAAIKAKISAAPGLPSGIPHASTAAWLLPKRTSDPLDRVRELLKIQGTARSLNA
jgi:hypothetical protein